GAEQVGFAQRGEYGKERLGAADFVAEKFKGVGQGVADWKTERPQPERVQENVHLVPNADGAVLQVAVVKAEAGVQENFLHAVTLRDFDLSRKILAHHFNRVATEIEIADFADVFALHVTKDHRRTVVGDHSVKFVTAVGAGKIQNVCAGFEAGPRDGGLIRLD